MTVTILGKSYPVILPTRHAERRELVLLRYTNAHRGSAAILGVTVPKLWEQVEKGGAGLALTFTYRSCGSDWAEYGARVWEALVGLGVKDDEMVELAAPIDAAITALAFPTQAEVTEAVGFTDPTGGP